MRLNPISTCERLGARASKPAAVLALFVSVLFPDHLAAQGLPGDTGSHLPIWIWFIGAGILGLAIAYGIMRNRSRSGPQKQVTEQATKNLYAEQERERVRSGAE
jgi:hypothetical protein